jgi:UDP-N-acetylmuramoylalanine--D-glutamate ligase
MHIALLGFDTEGRASYEYFAAKGDDITICDQNTAVEVPTGATSVLGDNYLDNLDRFDLLVRTAGMKPELILEKNPEVAGKITTLLNVFLEVCPTKNVIGITGTKGKGTTSTLTANMLEAAGKTVRLGGNIGVPPLTFLADLDENSWVVLELSSFQLSDVAHSPHIGVCLMVVPEHLNWHPDMSNYTQAKSRLFMHQNSDDIAIYFADSPVSKEIAAAGAGQKLPYYAEPGAWVNGNMITIAGLEVCTTDELKLLGAHNWQNVCAAVTAVWQAGVRDIAAMRSVLTTFSGLEHRLEKVRELQGHTFYNDSFAATPEAAIAAAEAVPGNKVMIVGGFDRMLPIDHLAKALGENQDVRAALLVGTSAERLAQACQAAGLKKFTVSSAKDMPSIVHEAMQLAEGGDAVVLSPGFASFDMFKNFEDRGNQFKAAVEAL